MLGADAERVQVPPRELAVYSRSQNRSGLVNEIDCLPTLVKVISSDIMAIMRETS